MKITYLQPGEDPTKQNNPHPRQRWGMVWLFGLALLAIGGCLAFAIPQAIKANDKEGGSRFNPVQSAPNTDVLAVPSVLPITVTATGSPRPVVVTALVENEIRVPVEVTRLVEIPVTVEIRNEVSVPVEVTRIVEVSVPLPVPVTVQVPAPYEVTRIVSVEVTRIVTATPSPTPTATSTPTASPTGSPTPSLTAESPTATITATNTPTPTEIPAETATESPTGND